MSKKTERAECQICGKNHALKNGKLVNHGYQRPGWGWLVGGCWGVGYRPFPETDALEAGVEKARAEAARLRDFAVTTTTVRVRCGSHYQGRTYVPEYRKADNLEEYQALRQELGLRKMPLHRTYEEDLEKERKRILGMAAQADEAADIWTARIAEGKKIRGEA